MFSGVVAQALRTLPAGRASTVGSQLKHATTLMHSKIGNLQVHTIKGHADTQRAVECFNPELLGNARMLSHAQLSKHVPQISRAEWEQYVVMPPPTLLPTATSACVAWWVARSAALPALSFHCCILCPPPPVCMSCGAHLQLVGSHPNARPPQDVQ